MNANLVPSSSLYFHSGSKSFEPSQKHISLHSNYPVIKLSNLISFSKNLTKIINRCLFYKILSVHMI